MARLHSATDAVTRARVTRTYGVWGDPIGRKLRSLTLKVEKQVSGGKRARLLIGDKRPLKPAKNPLKPAKNVECKMECNSGECNKTGSCL